MPLANRLLSSHSDQDPTYPLEVLLCPSCHLSQLSVVVPPSELYSHYTYRSSISDTFRAHCQSLASSYPDVHKVIEIASNDGCLLEQFKALGKNCIGIEPASNLADISRSKGIDTLNRFWDASCVSLIGQGSADLVVALNVLAHVHDLRSFLSNAYDVLTADGLFVFEVPYALTMIHGTEFDTIYHEHLSYFLLGPLKSILESVGLIVLQAKEVAIHGGSIRVTCSKSGSPDESIDRLLSREEHAGMYNLPTYQAFSLHAHSVCRELLSCLRTLKNSGKDIAAFGASAKGNVLLNHCGIGSSLLDYIVDDTPEKQGKYSPGNHLPIYPRSFFEEHPPDYLLILAWNFADEIMDKTKWFHDQGGQYIIPLPELKIL